MLIQVKMDQLTNQISDRTYTSIKTRSVSQITLISKALNIRNSFPFSDF